VGGVVVVKLYRFSRFERMNCAPGLPVLDGEDSPDSTDSGTEGGCVVGIGGREGMRLGDGTRGVYEARREDLRGSGGGAISPSEGVRMLQSWTEILGDEVVEECDDAVSESTPDESESRSSFGDVG
jgi:hypothetical protein